MWCSGNGASGYPRKGSKAKLLSVQGGATLGFHVQFWEGVAMDCFNLGQSPL